MASSNRTAEEVAVDGVMILGGLVVGLVGLGVAAWRWGTDTTEAMLILDRNGRLYCRGLDGDD